MTVRINKQKINLREKLAEVEDKVNFDEVIRGLGEYDGNVGIRTTTPVTDLEVKTSAGAYNETAGISTYGITINDSIQSSLNLYNGGQGSALSRIVGLKISNSNSALAFITQNSIDGRTEKMRITSSGNVGIGTTSPQTKLHIETAETLTYSPTTLGANSDRLTRFRIKNNSEEDLQTASIGLISSGNNGTSNAEVALNCIQETDTSSSSIFTIQQRKGDRSYHETFRIESDGNVGIGTADPSGKLDVNSFVDVTSDTVLCTSGQNTISLSEDLTSELSAGDIIRFNNQNLGDVSNKEYEVGSITSNLLTLTENLTFSASLYISKKKSTLSVTSGGNVGIGTASPSAKLEIVDGNSSVRINQNGESAITFESDSFADFHIAHDGTSNNLHFSHGSSVGSAKLLTINANSRNVGIGTTSPDDFKLNVQSDVNTVPIKGYRATATATAYLLALNSNIGTGSDVVKFRVEADGDVISATNSYTSDERAKSEISDLNYGLDTIKQLKPKQFKMRHSEEKGFKYGFIAQEAETILPDLIRNDGIEDGEGGSYKALEYNSIIAILTKAIQELKSEIDSLKSQLNPDNSSSTQEPAVEEASEEPVAEEAPVSIGASISSTSLDDINNSRAEEL